MISSIQSDSQSHSVQNFSCNVSCDAKFIIYFKTSNNISLLCIFEFKHESVLNASGEDDSVALVLTRWKNHLEKIDQDTNNSPDMSITI